MKEQKLESNMEKLLRKDAENIEIDHEFKKDLKNKIMGKVQEEKVIHIDKKRKLNINIKRYLKIASGFVICAFLGTNIYPALSNNIFNFPKSEKQDKINNKKTQEENILTVKEITQVAKIIPDENQNDMIGKAKNEIDVSSTEKNNSHSSSDTSEKENQPVKENKNNDMTPILDSPDIPKETKISGEKMGVKEEKEVKIPDNVNKVQGVSEEKESFLEKKLDKKSEEISPENNSKEIPLDNNGGESQSKNITQYTEDEDINKVLLEDAKNKRAATGKEQEETDELTPKIEEVSEKNNVSFGCYDSRNSKDGKTMVKAEKGNIYLVDNKNNTKSIIEISSDKKVIADKPNFLSNNTIIYCKKEIEGSKKAGIYKYNILSGEEEFITNGINPMVSKDEKKIAFELDGKVLIKFLESNAVESIDEGKYPSWSENGEYLSYVKEELEYSTDDTGDNKVNKKYTTIWIYNSSTKKKNSITNKEFITDDSNIQQWADEIRGGQKGNQFDLFGKYSYFESIWSNDNKSLFVIRKDNENSVFEFVKVDLK